MRYVSRVALLILLFTGRASGADERLWIAASIEQKPVRFWFDTGAHGESIVLWREAVDRLALSVKRPVGEGGALAQWSVEVGETEPANLTMFGLTGRTVFGIVDTPSHIPQEGDGVVPWRVIRNNVMFLDVARNVFAINQRLPRGYERWLRLGIVDSNPRQDLCLSIPAQRGVNLIVGVDTGQTAAVILPAREWRKWLDAHPKAPVTFSSYFMLGIGHVHRPTTMAKEFRVGDLALKRVMLVQANALEEASIPADAACILGFGALRQLKLVLDGPRNMGFVRASGEGGRAVETYNRLGAVFSRNAGGDWVAEVAPRSPAEIAGLREGDVLLRVDNTAVTAWNSDADHAAMNRWWVAGAGTKYDLVLRRGARDITVTVVLRDLFR